MRSENEPLEQLPKRIVERLREQDRAIGLIAPQIDNALKEQARAYFAQGTVHKYRTRRPLWVAMAATVVVAITVLSFIGTDTAGPNYADVDGSGQVDIVDVLLLARQRARDESTVSQQQIDILARHIVALDTKELGS